MYRLATCFWVSLRTLSPQGLSVAPVGDIRQDMAFHKPFALLFGNVISIPYVCTDKRED